VLVGSSVIVSLLRRGHGHRLPPPSCLDPPPRPALAPDPRLQHPTLPHHYKPQTSLLAPPKFAPTPTSSPLLSD
jgi:hypothetical protein